MKVVVILFNDVSVCLDDTSSNELIKRTREFLVATRPMKIS
jgi:hypothetical protein